MKKILFLFITGFIAWNAFSQTGSVGIGTPNPNSSAALDIQSTTKGILIPRMTTVQRNAIAAPATGLLVFDNTTNSFWFKSAVDWVELSDSANNVWRKNGSDAYVDVPNNVGIGTTSPQYHLEINKPNASIGFTDAQLNQFSGAITGNSNTLNITAARTLIGQGTPGNLLLQTNAFLAGAGNVGIGTTTPTHKLDINGDTRIQGNLGIGVNNPVERLEVSGSMVVSNFIRRPPTGFSNLVPVCYGIVNSNGDVVGGTGNFTAQDIVPPFATIQAYRVDVDNMSINLNTDVIMITPFNPENGDNITTTVVRPSTLGYADGGFLVVFRKVDATGFITRSNFSFMVFRP